MNTETLIRHVDDDRFVGSSRVTVEDIVVAQQQGLAPEQIQAAFPSLSLAQVYGAIVYYLEHREELNAQFAEHDRISDEQRTANHAAQAEFYAAIREHFAAAHQRRDQQP